LLNLNKLSKALKAKSVIRWVRKDNHDYILNDYWVLKTSQLLTGSSITPLVKIFGTIPAIGKGLGCKYGTVTELSESEIKSTLSFFDKNDVERISFTNLIYQAEDMMLSIFKASDGYVYVDKTYVDLVNLFEGGIEIYAQNRYSGVYFVKENEEIMILPVRAQNNSFYLKEND
jgi:hypothetical protein